ncbi:chorismate mutase [Longirhabdus pacifica]|uniref:chorismate mutase n=1 Tax=Longirhabdus pacifica TaxID=2305227 RepID=UPI001009366B|nr:chorismate mutase [Longirhabdus pacifica]
MYVRGIRGATTVEENVEQEILDKTSELLRTIVEENNVNPADICSVFVTVTADVDDVFPALAIRNMPGWEMVPLMCSLEIPIKDSLQKCIRLMLHANTEKEQGDMRHVYLHEAKKLRPDLCE